MADPMRTSEPGVGDPGAPHPGTARSHASDPAPHGGRSYRFSVASDLAASAEILWAHATTPAGVNRELMPLVRMTFPAGAESLMPASITLGARLFRSWILLFGVIPIDYDDVTVIEIEPGRRFLERSPMLTQRLWEHERIVAARPGGCRVTDRVRFVPRVGVLGPLYRPVFHAAFRLRHRNLRRLFGGPGP